MSLLIQQLIELWGLPRCSGSGSPVGTMRTVVASLPVICSFPWWANASTAMRSWSVRHGRPRRLVSRDWAQPLPPELLHWRVDDTLAAYQQLALLHRRQLARPLVAVTGSAGKTTTRELIRAALASLGPGQ